MTKTCIAYATTRVRPPRSRRYIADVIRAHGQKAEILDLRTSGHTAPSGYDAVIVGVVHPHGAPRQARPSVREAAPRHLERVPSAFFSVSLAAHGDEHEAEGYVERFEEETGWRPARVALFSGALLYTQYGFIKRRGDEEDRR